MTEAPSRAGRNLPAAIASGVVLGAIVLATLFTVQWASTARWTRRSSGSAA